MSELALGCELLGGTDWGTVDRKAAMEAVRTACSRGITVFDTADIYGLGNSERLLAEALGEQRKDATICTKFGVCWRPATPGTRAETFRDCRPQRVREAVEGSLERLKLDCLPICLMHWPDPAVPLADTMEALARLQQERKVLHAGVSNCSAQQIRAAHAVVPLSVVQLPLSLVTAGAGAEAIRCCMQLDIAVMAYGPLAQGLLTGKYDARSTFGANDRRHRLPHFRPDYLAAKRAGFECLMRLSRKYRKSPAQVALRWVLDYPGVTTVVAGARNPAQVEENLGSLGWTLPRHEWRDLSSLWGASPADDVPLIKV